MAACDGEGDAHLPLHGLRIDVAHRGAAAASASPASATAILAGALVPIVITHGDRSSRVAQATLEAGAVDQQPAEASLGRSARRSRVDAPRRWCPWLPDSWFSHHDASMATLANLNGSWFERKRQDLPLFRLRWLELLNFFAGTKFPSTH